MQATVVHVAVVFFFFSYFSVNVLSLFGACGRRLNFLPEHEAQGHVNTDICFKPRVDTLLSLPLIFAFHAHVTLFILQPI